MTLRDDESSVKVLRANPDKVARVPSNDHGCVYDIDSPEYKNLSLGRSTIIGCCLEQAVLTSMRESTDVVPIEAAWI